MKKIDTHIYIVLGLFIAGFVIGSFFDAQISNALFIRNETAGLVVSVIGTVPGYGILAFMGGGFLLSGLLQKDKKWFKIVLIVLSVATLGIATFFAGREFFGPNGFYWIGVKSFWGYFIAFPAQAVFFYLGYLFAKKTDNDKLWIVYLVLCAAFLLANVLGTTLIKAIVHRPRYRSLDESIGLYFHRWYQRTPDYKYFMETYKIGSDEFKSFPSGHASTTACLMMFMAYLPHMSKKFEKLTIPAFYVGLAWCLLISFARIRVGAHFLSDVSMGALLSIIFFFVGKIVIENTKLVYNSGQQVSE